MIPAQERRRLVVGEDLGDRIRPLRGHDRVLRVAAVVRPAGEARPLAEVRLPFDAEFARSAGRSHPRDSNTVADREAADARADRVDRADDFVTGDERTPPRFEVSLDDVEVRAADAAHPDAHSQVARSRHGCCELLRRQRTSPDRRGTAEKDGSHVLRSELWSSKPASTRVRG
jgi:hypothetical protein